MGWGCRYEICVSYRPRDGLERFERLCMLANTLYNAGDDVYIALNRGVKCVIPLNVVWSDS
jgi:hypothetical protein